MRRLSRQAWLFAAAGFAISARAQVQPPPPAEGPVLVGVRHESWSAFELERVQASLEFLGQYQTDRQRTAAGTTLKNRESLFRETLDLEGEASIGHKNLLDLTGAIQLGLEDRFTDSQSVGFQGHESDLVGLYDIRGLFLGNGPAPTTLYTRREQDFLNQAFAGTIEQTTQESGVITQIQSERAPTTLHYFHRTQELKDQFGQLTSSTAQDTFNLQSGIRITDGQRLDIAYTFDHIDEQQPGFGGDTYDRQDANIVHTLDFGGESRPHELRSGLRIYDQGGRFSQSETRLDELLILHHSDRLETRGRIALGQKKGRLTVEFASVEDLNRILDGLPGGPTARGPGQFQQR